MRNMIMTILAVILAVTLVGCSEPPSSVTEERTTAAQEVHDDHATPSTATPSADKVEVGAAGTKFDPSVDAKRIPDEAWACVMGGKVHYASMQKGDGTCPVCEMKLIQHAAHSEQ